MDSTDHDIMSPREDLLTRDELRSKFGILNYVVFIMMLLVSAMIGRDIDNSTGGKSHVSRNNITLFFKT